jgi:hypothetical protein
VLCTVSRDITNRPNQQSIKPRNRTTGWWTT